MSGCVAFGENGENGLEGTMVVVVDRVLFVLQKFGIYAGDAHSVFDESDCGVRDWVGKMVSVLGDTVDIVDIVDMPRLDKRGGPCGEVY